MLRIPLFVRGRANHASSAESAPRRMTFYRHSTRETFTNPLPTPAKIAVLAALFEERNGVRCFEPEAVQEIQAFRPQILAGSVKALLRLAAEIKALRALVVFSGARLGEVNPRDRDLLWRAFQIPLFEQRLAANGTVIARECEAHDGLHVTASVSFDRPMLINDCECGRTEARIGFCGSILE